MIHFRFPIDKCEMVSTPYPPESGFTNTYPPQEWDIHSSLTVLLERYLGNGRGNYKAWEAIKAYKVSTLRDHDGAKLWRCDRFGNPLNGQIILFGDEGEVTGYFPITHCLWRYTFCEYALKEAFFGGHLLGSTNKPVAVVEDEITALLGSQAEPRYAWLAVGRGQNLTAPLLAQLAGYRVTLFPDSMAEEAWKELAAAFPNVTVCNAFTERDINAYLAGIARGYSRL